MSPTKLCVQGSADSAAQKGDRKKLRLCRIEGFFRAKTLPVSSIQNLSVCANYLSLPGQSEAVLMLMIVRPHVRSPALVFSAFSVGLSKALRPPRGGPSLVL